MVSFKVHFLFWDFSIYTYDFRHCIESSKLDTLESGPYSERGRLQRADESDALRDRHDERFLEADVEHETSARVGARRGSGGGRLELLSGRRGRQRRAERQEREEVRRREKQRGHIEAPEEDTRETVAHDAGREKRFHDEHSPLERIDAQDTTRNSRVEGV